MLTVAVLCALLKFPGTRSSTVISPMSRLGVVAELFPVAIAVATDGWAVAPFPPGGQASVNLWKRKWTGGRNHLEKVEFPIYWSRIISKLSRKGLKEDWFRKQSLRGRCLVTHSKKIQVQLHSTLTGIKVPTDGWGLTLYTLKCL